MSAVLAPLQRDELFWFGAVKGQRVHAFELVEGELEPLSVCGRVPIEHCEDEPILEVEKRRGWQCMFCLSVAATP